MDQELRAKIARIDGCLSDMRYWKRTGDLTRYDDSLNELHEAWDEMKRYIITMFSLAYTQEELQRRINALE